MRKIIMLLGLFLASSSLAASLTIPMYEVAQVGYGKSLGSIIAMETPYGVLFLPQLKGLVPEPRVRGFHVHEGQSCDNFGQAALGHLDPEKTNRHLGPYEAQGHLGDLQVLIINQDGSVTLPVLAPRLTLEAIAGHTLVIHANGDNYSDHPKPLGGGDYRVACGKIPNLVPAQLEATSKPITTAENLYKVTSPPISTVIGHQIQQLRARKQELQQLREQTQEELHQWQQLT